MIRKVSKYLAILLLLYFSGWMIISTGIYLIFHTGSNITSEVIAFYEKLLIGSFVYLITIPFLSVLLTVIYKIKRDKEKRHAHLVFTVITLAIFMIVVLTQSMNAILYHFISLLEAL